MENDLHVKKNMSRRHPTETAGTPQNTSVRRIPLDLRHHCIQTALKRLFEHQMHRYFTTPDSRKDLEPLLDVLGDILASWDFAVLRSMGLGLEGGQIVDVHLVLPKDGAPFLEVSGTRIDPCSQTVTASFPLPES